MKDRLLVAVGDDDAVFLLLVKKWLELAGHRAQGYASAEDFRRGLSKTRPDLVILDVVFGSEDGRAICQSLNQDPATRDIPVIMVSALRQEVADIVEGLNSGAADYLLKPLNRKLLLAKIESVMRRYDAPRELAQTLELYGLRLNVPERRVVLDKIEVLLTRMEFDLLAFFLRHPRQALSTRHLLETVWGRELETNDDPATVHVHVSRLRKKLGKGFAERLVTLVNSGYRLD